MIRVYANGELVASIVLPGLHAHWRVQQIGSSFCCATRLACTLEGTADWGVHCAVYTRERHIVNAHLLILSPDALWNICAASLDKIDFGILGTSTW